MKWEPIDDKRAIILGVSLDLNSKLPHSIPNMHLPAHTQQ